jgi:MFS family permease
MRIVEWLKNQSVDIAAYKSSADFRRYFWAGLISRIGSLMTYIIIPLQIAQLTGSYLAVGAIGLIQITPLVVFGIWGGAIADVYNRKRIAFTTEIAMGFVVGLLAWNTLQQAPSLTLIYLATFLFACLDGIQRPSLDALLPQVVEPALLMSASALGGLTRNFAAIIGPGIGGLIAATSGIAFTYFLDIGTYIVSAFLILGMKVKPHKPDEKTVDIKMMFSGFNYVKNRQDLLGTYAIDTIAMIFAFPVALFPFIARDYQAPWALGLLFSALSAGAFLAGLASGWTNRIHQHGKAIAIAAAIWGMGIAVAGLVENIYVALFGMFVAGAADYISGVFRSVVWNLTIPLELRGRLAGIEMLSYSLGPQIGKFGTGFFANFYGLQAALITGGMACTFGAIGVAKSMKTLWDYDDRTNEHAIAEREKRKL